MSGRDIKGRLETIRICTDGSVATVIVQWLIDAVAGHLLQVAPAMFWRPYYNTPLVPMLRAHADREIIRFHAFVCGSALCKTCRAAGKKRSTCTNDLCDKAMSDGITLRGLDDLKNHRDVLGHPLTHQLERPKVRKFVDDRRDREDVRPALMWDIHRSIVDAQTAAGAKAKVVDVTIGPYQTDVLDSILRLCLQPHHPPIERDVLTELMTALWNKARVEFERHPDGRFPRKTDAELGALYEKMKKAWYDSRARQETDATYSVRLRDAAGQQSERAALLRARDRVRLGVALDHSAEVGLARGIEVAQRSPNWSRLIAPAPEH